MGSVLVKNPSDESWTFLPQVNQIASFVVDLIALVVHLFSVCLLGCSSPDCQVHLSLSPFTLYRANLNCTQLGLIKTTT
jgi:hypothetical protein